MIQFGQLYSQPLQQLPIVVIDLETTGLHTHTDAICELGAVQFKGELILGTYSALVNPFRDIPDNVIEIHHLTPDMLKNAPPLDEVLPTFLQFLGASALAGHNAAFDLGFLTPAVRHLGVSLNQRPVLDTAFLARKLLPNQQGYSLSRLAKELELPSGQFHRALDDATTTAYLLQHLIKVAASQGLHTLAALEAAYPSKLILKDKDDLEPLEKAIWGAIEHTTNIDIEYCNRDGEVRQRRVSPERLDPPYLYAFCHLRQEQRCFRLSRISSYKLVGPNDPLPSPPEDKESPTQSTQEAPSPSKDTASPPANPANPPADKD